MNRNLRSRRWRVESGAREGMAPPLHSHPLAAAEVPVVIPTPTTPIPTSLHHNRRTIKHPLNRRLLPRLRTFPSKNIHSRTSQFLAASSDKTIKSTIRNSPSYSTFSCPAPLRYRTDLQKVSRVHDSGSFYFHMRDSFHRN